MSSNPISPVGRYQPEVLLLAPEAGEDANTLSLVSQCLELGLSIELDEHWRLPTAPPRDLSAYKACLFPDTARAKYDADLNAFQRAGGFLVYTKYYPTSRSSTLGIDHAIDPVEFNGRDVFTFHLANMLLQAGLTQRDPAFVATMRARPLRSILSDQRAAAHARYADAVDAWDAWKDPDALFLECNRVCATASGDAEWIALMKRTYRRVADSHRALLRTDQKISSQLEDYVEPYVQLFGWLLMVAGHAWSDASLTDAGIALGRFWYEHNHGRGGGSTPATGGKFSEDMIALPALAWLTRLTGDTRYAEFADRILDDAAASCLRESGLWSHWVDCRRRHQSAWSRATAWPLHGMVLAMEATDPQSPRGARLMELIGRTYDGLAKVQDRDSGLWHCVLDEPFTRLESSGTCAFMFLYDRLHAMGLADAKHAAMIDRAFAGLLPLCYRNGISAFCRGTDYGSPAYYRSRPLGFSPSSSFFVPTVAARV